jgi:teichuronic acid biosynthesis glycosyltransferase TuaG
MSKISIITACYNAQDTLAQTIQSVLDQDYHNFQLIIVDDGSTDNSITIAEQFLDPRIELIKKKNGGVASARNLALNHVTGDYICFLDADDLMTKQALSCRMKLFLQHTNIAIIGGAQKRMNATLTDLISVDTPSYRGNPTSALMRLDPNCFITCGTWLFRKSLVQHHRFPLGWTHSEDLAFFYLISKNAYHDFVTEEVQVYRRLTSSAMTNLDGLLDGYLRFIRLIRKDKPSKNAIVYLKLKIMKIMFLSFWAAKKHNAAFACLKTILKT